MTQPPCNIAPSPMAHDRRGPAYCSPRRLFKGTCSLIFEGRSFVPAGGTGKEYCLKLSDEMRERLMELLAPLGWQNEMETFEAEFYGTLTWAGHDYGHLGPFGGIARVQEIVSVRFGPVSPPRATVRHVVIAGRLKTIAPRHSTKSCSAEHK